MDAHERAERGVMRRGMGCGGVRAAEGFGKAPQQFSIAPLPGAGGGGFDKCRALEDFALEIAQAGGEFFFEFVLPGKIGVTPRLDREFPVAGLSEDERAGPAVVRIRQRAHRRLGPIGSSRAPPFHHRSHFIMPFLENVGCDFKHAAGRPFDGEPRIVERGFDAADDYGFAAFVHGNESIFCTSGPSPSRPEATSRSDRMATGMCERKCGRFFWIPRNP